MDPAAFEAHPLWPALEELEGALGEAEARHEPTAEPHLNTLRYLVAAVEAHRDPSDFAPYTNVSLNNVHSNLPNVTMEVRNYAGNGEVGHLGNAVTHGDQVLYQAGLLPTAGLKGGAAAQANKLFGEYRDSAQETISMLQATNAELENRIAQQRGDLESTITNLQSQVEGLAAKLTQDEARLDTALVTNNEQFTAKQTEREEKFNAWLEQQGSSLTELASGNLGKIVSYRDSARVAYGEVDQLRDDTKTVAGLAAGDQVARGYKSYSVRQWVAGLTAYILGFAALGKGADVVLSTIKTIKPGDPVSWEFATLKLGLTASIVFAAIVAFRLGSHLLSEASTAKRFELELKALGPLFPKDEEQVTLQAVKKDLIERSFGQGWGTNEKSKELMNEKLIEKLVHAIARGLGVRPSGD